MRRSPFPLHRAVLGGVAAAIAAGLSMLTVRWTLSVRSIPERVMEALLLYVSPDQFEAALLRFGFDAKRYALYAAVGVVLLVLAALGALALCRRWSRREILALGVGLWLVTMVVIMPLTEAGFFASDLVDGTTAAIGGYLTVALTYAATLGIVSALLDLTRGPWHRRAENAATLDLVSVLLEQHAPATSPAPSASERPPARRSALLLTGGALASFVGTFLLVRLGPGRNLPTRVVVLDPQEPVPSGGIDPPKPHPNLVTTPDTAPVQDAPVVGPGNEATPVAAPSEQSVGLGDQPPTSASEPAQPGIPEPPPSREMARDQDGSVMPSGRQPGELSAIVTPTQEFYIVTKNAAGDPSLQAADWRLRIDGDVQRSIELDYASLRNLPSVEVTKTLECISNFVDQCELAPFGCGLISTARWKGVPLGTVLDQTGGLRPGVVSLSTISADEFTTSLPIEVALDPNTLLVYEMNGQVLPREHGYPARILVPGRYGMKNAKWVVALRPLRREVVDWYGQRQWSKEGIIKTMTRIDTPARGAKLPPGDHRIAGIAYAGDRGIAKVEFSTDDGISWRVAELLEPAPGRDTWVRWQGRFTLASGAEVKLVSRATDSAGDLQIAEFKLPQPDGSSGWHHVTVRAGSA